MVGGTILQRRYSVAAGSGIPSPGLRSDDFTLVGNREGSVLIAELVVLRVAGRHHPADMVRGVVGW